MKDKFFLYDVLVEGFEKTQESRKKVAEQTKGIWRAGNSGCLLPSGDVIGGDPKEAVLRFMGVEMPSTYDDSHMLQAGFLNEEGMTEYLSANPSIEFRCEEEIPLRTTLSNGDLLTGRPDIVLGTLGDPVPTNSTVVTDRLDDFEFKPYLGVEAKLVCSTENAFRRSTWGPAEIDPKHFVQAAHYAGFFNIPWVLAYTSRGWNSIPFYAGKNPDKWFNYIEHRAVVKSDKGVPFISKPYQAFYDVTLAEDGDTFLLDDVPTSITKSGILAFYEYCSHCVANKIIPTKRGGGLDVWSNPLKKNKTIIYDDFRDISTENKTFDQWVEECRQLVVDSSE